MNGFKGYFWNLFKFKSSLLLYEGSGKLKINQVTSHCPRDCKVGGVVLWYEAREAASHKTISLP
jgi:hypothetical protein